MAASSSDGVLCGICDVQHITKCAEYWCLECEEGLCSDCHKHHSLCKATRTHDIIGVDKYHKLPSSSSVIVHHCNEHGMKYSNYCPQHDKLCCPICISKSHGQCRGFLSIQEMIKTTKTSTLLDNMERSLNDTESNLKKIIHNCEYNLSDIRQQKQKIHDNVKQLRVKMNSHLDTLEQNFIRELIVAENAVQSKIKSLIHCLSKEQETVSELKNNITALKEHGSDLQTFFGSKTYQPEVVKSEQYMESLSKDGSLNQLNLKCSIDDKIWKQFSQITPFGSVSIKTGPPTLVIKTEKNKQAQITAIMQQSLPKSTNDINISLLCTYNIPNPDCGGYRGCIIHPSGRFLLTDDSSSPKLIVYDGGRFVKRIPCSASYVSDVKTIDERTVAMSTSNGIHIINIDFEQRERVYETSRPCYGITFHKGILLWCEAAKGLQRMDMSSESITTLVKQQQLPNNSYVTTYDDKIYQTNNKTKTVTCYTIDGQMQWEYKNEAVLKDPTCVTVDNRSHIYVTSPGTNSVVMIIPDRKEGRELISKSEGIDDPWGIHFEKKKNNLLIVNRRGPMFLYYIS